MGTRGLDLRWTHDAACREYPTELFFTDGPGENLHDAKRICADCPVATQCLDYADAYETGLYGNHNLSYGPFGIYGGLSPRQRVTRRKSAETDGQNATDTDGQEAA